MVDREAVIANVTALVKEVMLRKNVELGPDDDLQAKVGLDSMGAVEIAAKLEDEYHIQVDDSDVKLVRTINDIADLLLKKIAHA
jgi:acyl carrier protein